MNELVLKLQRTPLTSWSHSGPTGLEGVKTFKVFLFLKFPFLWKFCNFGKVLLSTCKIIFFSDEPEEETEENSEPVEMSEVAEKEEQAGEANDAFHTEEETGESL